MRKVTLTLAAAGAALAFAAPASAQYFPAPQPGYGYGQPGYGYGYSQGNYGQVRSLQARVDGIQRQIEFLYQRRAISRDERNGLRSDARQVEYRLRRAASYGLNGYEARDIQNRIYRLERHVSREVRDGRGYGYNNRGYGYPDRDRDGRDDRREDDRGWDHD